MSYEQRDNSGSVFVNDRKDKDTHPDRTGTAMIDGKNYWVSGWIKKDRNGKSFMSLAFKPKEEQKPAPKKPDPISSGRLPHDDMDDAIPFGPELR
jgi:hypothetical protein